MVLYGISYLSLEDYASEVNGRDLLLPKPIWDVGDASSRDCDKLLENTL
jgi:hypothetical protein